MKYHIEWVKRWNRLHRVVTKSKPGEKKPLPRKIRKKISHQKEAIWRWLTEKYATTVVLDYEEEWCDDCFNKNCEAHTLKRDM
ncbi:hypothetical protein QL285_081969 [Trifolium repens]|nr:hypothetical protein QL285_081969 [Trifolium repens]